MMREGKRCVIYVHVSTEMQVDGFSLDVSKECIKEIRRTRKYEIGEHI